MIIVTVQEINDETKEVEKTSVLHVDSYGCRYENAEPVKELLSGIWFRQFGGFSEGAFR